MLGAYQQSCTWPHKKYVLYASNDLYALVFSFVNSLGVSMRKIKTSLQVMSGNFVMSFFQTLSLKFSGFNIHFLLIDN